MVPSARPQRLTHSLPLLAAAICAGLVALLFLLVPSGLLERAVVTSGIPAVLAAAEPPLGFTARVALGVCFGALAAGFAWLGVLVTAGDKAVDLGRVTAWLRRSDTHPDAPPRAPLFANRDLGTPMGAVPIEIDLPPVERDLPVDLNQPLAAFDPAAIPAVPMPAPEPLPALGRPQLYDPGDRFETFELTPVQRIDVRTAPPSLRVPPANTLRATPLRDEEVVPERVVATATESTVHELFARLERGIAGREPEIRPAAARIGSLEDTLGDLRRLATGRG